MLTKFCSPQVLIITPSVELSSLQTESIKFEDIVNQEKGMLKKIVEKIQKRFNPDIIIVENTINIVAL
jgi:hypothetical protein